MTVRKLRHRRVILGLSAVLATWVCAALVTLVAPTAQAAGSTLRSAAEAKGLYFGAALSTAHISEAPYASTAATQFDMVTPENEMKWDTVEASRGSFNYAPGDQVAAFAQAHSQRVRGHNLVWHSQLPGWVTSLPTNQVQAAMDNHITNEVNHYRGQIYAWDVVNEPFDDNGNLRTDVFFQAMGAGYIADALRTAHAADPAAKLYLNDYNIEGTGAKSNAMFNLVSSLKQQGVPIDGVGFESHLVLGQVPSSMQANLARFAALGVDVAITELDIRMPTPPNDTTKAQQANDYRSVVNACLAVSRCVGVTTWGVTDKYSWIPGTFPGQGAALLFDEGYVAKPAFNAVIQALGGSTTSPSPSVSPSPSRSPSPSPSTSPSGPPPASGCRVAYAVVNQWGGGFQADVKVTNTGSTAVNGWALRWTFANGQVITQLWEGVLTQSGAAVTVANPTDHNIVIAPNATVDFGFLASWNNATNAVPASFTLNGATCTKA
jgi:endo-1,4-beta-xylanase